MCRLYGFRANEPTKVECGLVMAQNSLLSQSRSDQRGVSHSDGWGIAYYQNGLPTVERRATAAFEDLRFSTAAERVFARVVVAHVRLATVGQLTRENTHPFVHGRWSYAHNGTVAGFEVLEERLVAETDPGLRQERRGTTDSEATFYWLLSRLAEAGVDLEAERQDLDELIGAFGTAVRRLAELSRRTEPERPERLNLLLTDGKVLVASRWNRELHWVDRRGVHDCEICGVPHIDHDKTTEYRAVVVASEPISREEWAPVPEHSLLAVGAEHRPRIEPI